MSKNITDRTLALGALFQSAWLVDQIARTGTASQAEYETCISSLFEFAPATTESVYGSRFELKRGLQTLIEQMDGNNDQRSLYIMRYAIGLIQLERKVSTRTGMLATIGKELEGTSHQLRHFGQTHPNVIARLADIYANTVSTLTPRIMVSGENNHLQKQENANKVRAVLLTGIRAAILWKQCGGSRWQLLFQRRKLIQQAKLLLA